MFKKIKRFFAFLLATMTLCTFLLTGCGSKGATHEEGEALEKLMISVGDAVVKSDSTLPELIVDTYLDEDAELNFSAVCDIDYKRVAAYYHAYAADGTAAEITIICANKESDVSAIMNSLQDHLDTRRGTMENYSPDQVEIVEQATMIHVGCYIGMFVGPKSGLDKNNFTAELEKNGIQ